MLIRRDTPWSWRWWGTCRRSSIGERVHEWICAASLCVSLCVRLWFVTLLPGVRRNRNISLWSNNPRLKHNTAVAFVLFILFIYFVCPREREPLSVRAIKCKSNDMIMDLPFCCQVGPLRHYTRPLVRCICNFLLHCCFSSLLQAANSCPKTVLKMHGSLMHQLTGNGVCFGLSGNAARVLLSETYRFSPGYKYSTAGKIYRVFSFERCQVEVGGLCFLSFGHTMYALVMSRKQCPRWRL